MQKELTVTATTCHLKKSSDGNRKKRKKDRKRTNRKWVQILPETKQRNLIDS